MDTASIHDTSVHIYVDVYFNVMVTNYTTNWYKSADFRNPSSQRPFGPTPGGENPTDMEVQLAPEPQNWDQISCGCPWINEAIWRVPKIGNPQNHRERCKTKYGRMTG
jgi:hypothetical protein